MDIKINTYYPANIIPGYCYLIGVEKETGEQNEYVVQIDNLPRELQEIFVDQYDTTDIKYNFFQISFFPLSKLHSNDMFGKDKSMKYSADELREFLEVGIGGAVQDFIRKLHPHAIIAIPARTGLGVFYDEVLRDCSAQLGYNYNESYKEFSIYVLET